MTEIKFLHTAMHRHENLFQVPVLISGFYNWHRSFNGDFKLYPSVKGSLESYDIIFIGMSKPELEGATASKIRRELGPNNKTKLVICIDYATELWPSTFNMNMLENELLQADMVFVSEPMMVSAVKSLVNDGITVHQILHPSDINSFKKFSKPRNMKSDEIIALIHRYDNNWISPYLATKDLPWNTHAVCLDANLEKHLYAYFKYINRGMECLQYMEWASRKAVIIDSYHKIRTYGRSAVEAACIGTPIVGSDVTFAQKMLFPDLTVESGDIRKQSQIITKLFKEKSFYADVVEKANDAVEFFSYENRKKELLNKLYN